MLLNEILLEKAVAVTRKEKPENPGASLSRRRSNAIDKAFRNLLENPYINYENGKLLILSDSRTPSGEAKFYETESAVCRLIYPGDYLCPAFWEGFPCWHRATLEIVENYFLIENGLNTPKKTLA